MKLKPLFLLSVFILLIISACKIQQTVLPSSTPQSSPITQPITTTPMDTQPSTTLKDEEITQIEAIHFEWDRSQMETAQFESVVNDLALETTYTDTTNSIAYTYFDFHDTVTPSVIDVSGTIPGPRGITVGDTFDSVLALFPNDKDWEQSIDGVFYGKISEVDEFAGAVGYVTIIDESTKIISSVTDSRLSIAFYFSDNILTHFKIYL